MKPTAKIACNVNGIFYDVGDEINVPNKEILIKLNELGFINPLTAIEIQNWDFNEKPIKKIDKKEDKKWA